MKSLVLILALILSCTNAHAQLTVTQKQIEQLSLPFTLTQTLEYLNKRLPSDPVLRAQKSLKIISEYHAFKATLAEISLLKKEKGNIEQIHKLNLKRQHKAVVEDEAVLKSEIQLITKKVAILRRTQDARVSLVRILEILAVQVRDE